MINAKQRSRQMTNSSKIKCRRHGKAGPVICIKASVHKLLIHSKFLAVRCLTKVALEVIEFISGKFSVVLQ